MIPFKVKLLTETAKAPEQANLGDLWDIFVDDFCFDYISEAQSPDFIGRFGKIIYENDKPTLTLNPQGRILVKTGFALELPKLDLKERWNFSELEDTKAYAVADLRPRSGLALKHGITVLNAPATIDNSYRKEIGVILINHGHETFTIRKGDKIAQMLIRPLYPSKMEIVDNINDSSRGGYGSTGK